MLDFIKFTRRGVLIDTTFIISDLHIGYCESIDALTEEKEREFLIQPIKNVINRNKISEIVIAGDVFDSFKNPSYKTRRTLQKIEELCSENSIQLHFIQGNHDNTAIQKFNKLPEFKRTHSFEKGSFNILVTHGHEPITYDENIDLIVIGHLHPNIRIENVQWPIYLLENKDSPPPNICVLPSFNKLQDGVIVSSHTDTNISFPFIDPEEFSNFHPIVYNDSDDSVKVFPILEKSGIYFG